MVDKRKQQVPISADSTALIGMKEICAFLRRSEPTVLKLVEQYPASIPIKKVSGVYESDRLELERWRREVLLAPAMSKLDVVTRLTEQPEAGNLKSQGGIPNEPLGVDD